MDHVGNGAAQGGVEWTTVRRILLRDGHRCMGALKIGSKKPEKPAKTGKPART